MNTTITPTVVKTINRLTIHVIIFSCLSLISPSLFSQETSKIFLEYQKHPSKSILPDFSYVGYHNGEANIPESKHLKTFNVLDFGAIPNDDLSDKKAIQSAIDAASKNGGGIVFFPKGRFLVNEKDDESTSISIKSSNIVLRGSGSGEGGTELFMKNMLLPDDTVKVLWKSKPMVVAKSGGKDISIGTITRFMNKGDNEVYLKNSNAEIKENDWIMLRLKDNDPVLIKKEMGIHEADTAWTNLVNNGLFVRMIFHVKKVTGNKLTLFAPTPYEIDPSRQWGAYKLDQIEEIGIEDLAIVGNWKEHFVHHRSWKDDSAFKLLYFENVGNCWVINCRFTDACSAFTMDKSANISVLNCKVTGNPGHEAISNCGSTNVLLGDITDEAGMWHSIGVANPSVNTVIWRCTYPSNTSFESHASQPRNTLLDVVTGGLQKNHTGGAKFNMPSHLSNLVLWNFHQTNQVAGDYDFWPKKDWILRIPMPTIVGYTGSQTFIQDQLKYQESPGKPVIPESLYEAQLALRLGKLPDWVKKYK